MPTYSEMVTEAILALKERSGSSVQAIKKHILSSHPDLSFAPHQLRSALKKGAEAGKYIKVKSSYKMSPDAKKTPLSKVLKKPAAKKQSPKKVTKKSPAAKKSAGKKTSNGGASKKTKGTVTKKSAGDSKKSAPAKKTTGKKTTPITKKAAKKPVSKAVSKKGTSKA